jgi:hypothetical protein
MALSGDDFLRLVSLIYRPVEMLDRQGLLAVKDTPSLPS